MKPSREIFLEEITLRSLRGQVRGRGTSPRGWGARPPSQGAPPASRLAHMAPGALLLPIYTYVPQKLHTQRENPNSTAVTSVPVEIPSWIWSSTGGGSITEAFIIIIIALTMSCE